MEEYLDSLIKASPIVVFVLGYFWAWAKLPVDRLESFANARGMNLSICGMCTFVSFMSVAAGAM